MGNTEHLKPHQTNEHHTPFESSSFITSPQLSYKAQAVRKIESVKFLSLGYGVVAYFDTLAAFIKLFFLFSLLNAPLIAVYSSFDGFASHNGATLTARTSLGNLGQS